LEEQAKAVAGAIAFSDQWRGNLARALFEPSLAPLRLVFTCSPGNWLSARGHVEPESARSPFEELFFGHIVPTVERSGFGLAFARDMGGVAFAPLVEAGEETLAQRVREELLAPVGAKGMLAVFLLDAASEVVGWIAVGTVMPCREALRELGSRLTAIASVGSTTLRMALDLAVACGAVPPHRDARLARLTWRELEIARLVASGLSDLNIAQVLRISENTVGSHLRRIYAKLAVHSRVEITALMGQDVLRDGSTLTAQSRALRARPS